MKDIIRPITTTNTTEITIPLNPPTTPPNNLFKPPIKGNLKTLFIAFAKILTTKIKTANRIIQ